LYGLLFYFRGAYMNAMMAFMSHDFGSMQRALPFIFAGYAIMFVLLTAQVAALTKEAMGLRRGLAWLQFPFGAAMWRLLIGYIALALVCIVLYFAVILVIVLGGVIGGVIGKLAGGAATLGLVMVAVGLFGFAVVCGFFYAIVRLSFLMAPAAIDGPQALRRGWALTRGNFWRIFLIGLSIFIPLLIAEGAYLYFVMGPDMLIPPHMQNMTSQALEKWQAHQQAASLAMMQHTQDRWYIVYPLGLLAGLILYGLMAGASGFAYRALVPLAEEMNA
jgi:hypothetical protein